MIRDTHRQRLLESLGWTFVRFLASQWYRPNAQEYWLTGSKKSWPSKTAGTQVNTEPTPMSFDRPFWLDPRLDSGRKHQSPILSWSPNGFVSFQRLRQKQLQPLASSKPPRRGHSERIPAGGPATDALSVLRARNGSPGTSFRPVQRPAACDCTHRSVARSMRVSSARNKYLQAHSSCACRCCLSSQKTTENNRSWLFSTVTLTPPQQRYTSYLVRFHLTRLAISVSPSTRRLLQRSGITPDQYEAWANLESLRKTKFSTPHRRGPRRRQDLDDGPEHASSRGSGVVQSWTRPSPCESMDLSATPLPVR